MRDHYGYIKGTVGKDKDPIDLFIKPGTSPDPGGPLFVVDQMDGDGRFDEHKVMAGYSSRQEAERAYLRNYARGWKGLGAMTEMSPDGFKSWLASGKTRRPAAESGPEGARPDDPVPTGGSVGEPGSGEGAGPGRRSDGEGGAVVPPPSGVLPEGGGVGEAVAPEAVAGPVQDAAGGAVAAEAAPVAGPDKTQGRTDEPATPSSAAAAERPEVAGDGVTSGGTPAELGGGASGAGAGDRPVPREGRETALARLDRDIRALETLRRRVARCVAA